MSISPRRPLKEGWTEATAIETSSMNAGTQWTTLRGMALQDRRALMKTLQAFLATQRVGTYPKTRLVVRLYHKDVLERRNVFVHQEKARQRAQGAASFLGGDKVREEWFIYPCKIPRLDYSESTPTDK